MNERLKEVLEYSNNFVKENGKYTFISKPRKKYKKNQCYALYKDEDILCVGTLEEISELRKLKIATLKFYATNYYNKKIEKNKHKTFLIKV